MLFLTKSKLVSRIHFARNLWMGVLFSNGKFLPFISFSFQLVQPNFWDDAKTAIKNAYRSTDEVILENSLQLGPGGTTAVTAIVIDGKDLWVANIGDSRAVMRKNGVAYQFTVDHEPQSERRIEEQGGFVTTLPGDVSRVNGQLAVARAFADENLKAHLSSDPDICNAHINSSTQFLILASDACGSDGEVQENKALES